MGSWKFTIGLKLAETLGMVFVDIDDAIEEVMEMKISDIFMEFGENKFREMETAYFVEIAKQTGHVFSTGGGIVLDPKNRKVLKKYGTTIFLKASTKILADRINNTTKRPLLNDSKNIHLRLEQIWKERKIYYKNSSHHTLDTSKLNPAQVLDEILNLLKVKFENH